MSLPTLPVHPAEFSIEDPWAIPPASEPVALRRSTDGAAPRLQTTIVAYADAECLNVLFQAQDDQLIATYLRHDEPLYEEDVVEVFLAPADLRHYYEIEVNPLGTTFDARIDSPDGVRDTMKTDISWNCEKLFAAIRRVPGVVDTIVRIPFASIDTRRPNHGEQWRGNFFRIDRHRQRGDEFSAWQPTLKNPADFHVPAVFGRLLFQR
jgi:cellulose/xylan binding protein with CBM9 domain